MDVLIQSAEMELDPNNDGFDQQRARIGAVEREALDHLQVHNEFPDDDLSLVSRNRVCKGGGDGHRLDGRENLGQFREYGRDVL